MKISMLHHYLSLGLSIIYMMFYVMLYMFLFFSVKVTEYEKDLAECRLHISQLDARIKTLQETMREAENKKRTLEEEVDMLREDNAKMKAAGECLVLNCF